MSERITTVEELDELPVGSVVVSHCSGGRAKYDGLAWQKRDGSEWHGAWDGNWRPSRRMVPFLGPLTVIHRPDTPAPSDDDRFHDIAHGVTEAYTPEGQAIWWRAWAMHPDARARMEAGTLAAWSGEPADDIVAADDEREALARIIDPAIYPDIDRLAGDGWAASLRAANAILAAGFRQGPVSVSREQVEAYCEVMHDAYEAAAVTTGWETQARSRKPWSDVPEPNKMTMRVAVAALLAALGIKVAD